MSAWSVRAAVLLAVCAGCGDASPKPGDAARESAVAGGDAGDAGDAVAAEDAVDAVAAEDAEEAFCAGDPRVQPLVGVVERPGMSLVARRDGSTPAGSARGLYTWTVTVRTETGPLPEGATLTATPRMPDHGHGARRPPVVRALGGGRFEVSALDLYMDGVWTVTLRVSVNGATETFVFGVCIG